MTQLVTIHVLFFDRTRNFNKEGTLPRFQPQQHTQQNNIRDISAGLARETHKQVCESNKDHVANTKGNYFQMT